MPEEKMAENGNEELGYNAASADPVTAGELGQEIMDDGQEQVYSTGQKRPFPGGPNAPTGVANKKKKKPASTVPIQKNALMQLNEIRPGLQYTVLEQSTKMHDPSFTIGVEINGQSFVGTAVSKKKAKQIAAEKALASFLAMPDSAEAAKILESGALDFTSDQGIGSNAYNSFEGANAIQKAQNTIGMEVTKTQPPGKNPVMILNELRPGTQYNFVTEEGDNHNKNFVMEVTLDGKTFQGNGRNKKLAKARAAQAALKTVYNLEFTNPPVRPAYFHQSTEILLKYMIWWFSTY